MSLASFRPFHVIQNIPLTNDCFELTIYPADNEPIAPFIAGQWVGIKMPYDPNPKRKIIALSIASAPYESQQGIVLTIKKYGERSSMLQKTKIGDIVNVQGPFGVFTLRPGISRLIFFAAGIGITPLRSMIRESLFQNSTREIILFYSNKTMVSTVYGNEFHNIIFVPILTQSHPAAFQGETRRVDAEMILAHTHGLKPDDEFLMCGPEEFMSSIKEILMHVGVDIKKQVRKELFS